MGLLDGYKVSCRVEPSEETLVLLHIIPALLCTVHNHYRILLDSLKAGKV